MNPSVETVWKSVEGERDRELRDGRQPPDPAEGLVLGEAGRAEAVTGRRPDRRGSALTRETNHRREAGECSGELSSTCLQIHRGDRVF